MFSVFRMGPGASGRGLCDIDIVLFRITKSCVLKNEKSLQDENVPILIQREKSELSVYFRRARTSQFLGHVM